MHFDHLSKLKLTNLLAKGLTDLNLSLSADTQDKIIAYLNLLAKWNRVYNLTAIRDPLQMMTRHILDSLAAAAYMKGPRIIDVGTGAGFPGIPLALVYPQHQIVLLDSNGKKTRFLIQVKAELELTNVEVVQARVEDYHPSQCFNDVIARAFTQLNDMILKTQHLCCTNGCLWAMKGIYPQEELHDLDSKMRIEVVQLRVPNLQEQRHLVCIRFNTNP